MDAERSNRPNILLVMADDLGWKDLQCQNNPKLKTPHIDQLALEGVRFTDAYAAAPVCSPTRGDHDRLGSCSTKNYSAWP